MRCDLCKVSLQLGPWIAAPEPSPGEETAVDLALGLRPQATGDRVAKGACSLGGSRAASPGPLHRLCAMLFVQAVGCVLGCVQARKPGRQQ